MSESATPAPLMLSISGCRGIFGKTITPEVAARYALVLAAYFRECAANAGQTMRPRVVLGRDGRAGGLVLAQAAAAGLAAGGCDVYDLGVAMTPTVGVMVDHAHAVGGLVVTASHNPQEWNGLKPIVRDARARAGAVSASAPGKQLADAVIGRYRDAVQHGAPGVTIDQVGTVRGAATGQALGLPAEGAFAHINQVREALKAIGSVEDRRAMGVSCVVDSVNASGAEAAKAFLGDRLKHHLGSSDGGVFPHAPEPTRENLTALARFVAEKHADIGFAQDPDADRLAIIDEKGSYIGEEFTLVLAAESLLGSGAVAAAGATICVNLSTSRMIEDVAARYGARVIRTAVGEANVVEAMKAHNAIIGGEGNGGVIWPKVTYIRDSLSAMGLVLALLARTGKSVSQLVAEMPQYAIVKRKVDLADPAQAVRAADAVAGHFSKNAIDRQDGVRVALDAERAWLHVRGSNTEPIMRLIAEAPTQMLAERLLDEAAGAIGRA